MKDNLQLYQEEIQINNISDKISLKGLLDDYIKNDTKYRNEYYTLIDKAIEINILSEYLANKQLTKSKYIKLLEREGLDTYKAKQLILICEYISCKISFGVLKHKLLETTKTSDNNNNQKKIIMTAWLALPVILSGLFFLLKPFNKITKQYHHGIYKGQVLNDSIKHGKGEFIYNENSLLGNGITLKGDWINDIRHGQFEATKEGKVFKGILNKDGSGILIADDGSELIISKYD